MAANGKYSGYARREVPDPDLELTQVGPGTPGGEYLRRFWHPVAHLEDLKDVPIPLRVMAEDLVLFRDGRGEIGLLHRHCAHRGTSLEFGMVEWRGLRCCYHGWLYDVDGRVLETPGEPEGSTLKDRVVHGAYPVREYKGLVFAYMGPPNTQPPFPRLSALEDTPPGWRAVARPKREITDCNWLQLVENIIDHSHAWNLHHPEAARARLQTFRPSFDAQMSLDDYFNRGLAEVYDPVYQRVMRGWRDWAKDWQEFSDGVLIYGVERVGEYAFLQVGGDYLRPNIVEFATPRRRRGPNGLVIDAEDPYEPPMATDWWVPVDDTHSTRIGFFYIRDDESTAFMQDVAEDDYERERQSFTQVKREHYLARQWQPADYDVQRSQGDVAIHGREHLGTMDKGVILIRKQLREGIRAVHRGEDPHRRADGTVACPCRNTIVRVPTAETLEADRALLWEMAQRFVLSAREAGDAAGAARSVLVGLHPNPARRI